MGRMYKEGWTLETIGEEFGITRERVRQIIRPKGGAIPTRVDPLRVVASIRKTGSVQKTGKELEHSPKAVEKCLKALGLWKAVKRLARLRRAVKRRKRREYLIGKLQEAARVIGHTPTTTEMNARLNSLVMSTSFVQAFGSIPKAHAAAGLTPPLRGTLSHKTKRLPITHCRRSGHELSPDNTYVSPKDGKRHCKLCRRIARKGGSP